ncbi:hypothetical protein Btru_070395 [Bulinus truncatus]|nr:hypothetical protein Btru_070395 [Bulinus truncatus]
MPDIEALETDSTTDPFDFHYGLSAAVMGSKLSDTNASIISGDLKECEVSPLIVAIEKDEDDSKARRKVVQSLLEHKADPNVRNKNNLTALMLAVDHVNNDLVSLLIKSGANVSDTDSNESGADINVVNDDQVSALNMAIECANEKVLTSLLLNGADGTVKVLTQHGADVNAMNEMGHCPLLLAIGTRSKDIVRHLIQNGADVNIVSANGDPLLLMYHDLMPVDILECLVKASINVTAIDS